MLLKLYTRIKRNPHLLKYCLEAFVDLTRSKLLITFFPFRLWKKRYGHFQCESLKHNVDAHHTVLHSIRYSVRCVARCVPWRSKCLDQAMAAQRMLQRRNLGNTLYFGMIRNQEEWLAHAWLRCGNQWVMGYHPKIPYTIVGTYAWIP